MIYFYSEQKRMSETSNIVSCEIEDILNYFKDKKYIPLDTETTGLDPHNCELLSIQVGDFENQFVIEYSPNVLKALKSFFTDKSKIWVLQNAKFDLQFFYKHNIILETVFDTYLAEGILYTGYDDPKKPNYVRRSLEVLALKYCGVILNKSIRGTINKVGLTDNVIKYGADDVKYLIPIMESQLKKIKEDNLNGAIKLDNLFVKVLAYIEFCGIYLDQDAWKKKMENDSAALSVKEFELNKWVLQEFGDKYVNKQLDLFDATKRCSLNWDSSKQIAPIFKELGIDVEIKDKKSGKIKDTIEAKHLKKFIKDSPLVEKYLEYKKVKKIVSTYGQNFIDSVNPKTGRIHASFWQLMGTGRTSCGSGKEDDANSINLQNIPSNPDTRNCFISQSKNTILIDCDYSQQEDRMYTELSQEPALIEFYNDTTRKRDGHSFTAKLCFPRELRNISEEDVDAVRPDLRKKAKGAKFAILFGGVGSTIASNLGISEIEGDEVYNAYFKAFPELKRYFEYIKPKVIKDGFVEFNNITHRRSYYQTFKEFVDIQSQITSEWWDKYKYHKRNSTIEFNTYYKPMCKKFYNMRGELERMALNYRCQGSAADMSKLAGVWFFDWIIKNNLFNIVKISNFIHDEYLAESPITISEKVANSLKDCMERAGKVFISCVPVKAEPCITEKWRH